MSPEQKQRRETILQADDENQYAVVELLSRSYVKDFPGDSLVWISRALVLTQFCRWDESDAAFERAMLTSKSAEEQKFIWLETSQSFKRRGMLREAEACYQSLIEIEPYECSTYLLLAHTTWKRGDLRLAEKRFRDALDVEGRKENRDEALFYLGMVLVALGGLKEAAQCYQRALALSTSYESTRSRLEDVERALEFQAL